MDIYMYSTHYRINKRVSHSAKTCYRSATVFSRRFLAVYQG